MKILLTGGGTAGHVVPHLALLDKYKQNFDKIIYIGSQNGIENNLVGKNSDLTYYQITTTKLQRGKIFANLLIPFKLIKGVHEAKKILKSEQPDVVFSKGGFVSLPVVIAGKRLKIPVIIHESDLNMGLANKLSRHYASLILTTFEQTAQNEKKKGVYTGSPIRDDMFVSKSVALKNLGISTTKPILVVTGGSQGSKFLNDKIRKEIYQITNKFFVIHITGKNNLDPHLTNSNYLQFDYVNNMGEILAAADVVVSRAGSNTIFELAALKKPMLLVPLPKGSSRGDQVDNAKYFNNRGYANFVTEEQLEENDILPYIERTKNEASKLVNNLSKANFKSGNDKIIEMIVKVAKEK